MKMEGIFFQNVAFRATEKNLVDALSEKLGEDLTGLEVKLFTSEDKKRRVAVVSGFQRDVLEIIPLLTNIKLLGKYLVAKHDRGDERNEFGDYVHRRTPAQMRSYRQLKQMSSRKLTNVFTRTFLSEMRGVLNFQSPNIYAYLNGLNVHELKKAGNLKIFHITQRNEESHGSNFLILEFQTVMEAVQAICLFNRKKNLNGREVIFSDKTGATVCRINRQKGIGVNGGIVNVEESLLSTGYLPFELLDEEIFDKTLTGAISKCWKCFSASRKHEFEIKGVSPDLSYVTGICNCNYHAELPVTHPQRPVKHGNEVYTRLMPNRSDTGSIELIPMHEAMKPQYLSPSNYMDIVAPILYDDWKTSSTKFKDTNTTHQASLRCVEVVDTENDGHLVINTWYAEIDVPLTDFWDRDCIYQLDRITVFLDVTREGHGRIKKKEVRRAAVFRAITNDERITTLITRLKLQDGFIPEIQDNMTVVPIPIKLEYQNTMRILKKLSKGELYCLGMETVFFPRTIKVEPLTCIVSRKKSLRNMIASRRMRDSLNAEQMEGLRKAQHSPISVVLGPPGTGKTYVAAVMAAMLGIHEEGCVLATAPSNYAADGLAIAIKAVLHKYKVSFDVLRVYAIARETQFIRESFNPLSEHGVPCLHQEVVSHSNWLKGEELENIRNALNNNRFEKLSSDEMLTFQAHKATLEQEVFDRFRIFVTTIGATSDLRVFHWSQGKKITTLMIDEAGQTMQPQLPFLFTFNQKRTIVLGDHLQLQPHVQSFGASVAGLERSYMEWIETGGKRVPWTGLKEQHRMNPGIRSLVSSLTYNNELRDADVITTRTDVIPQGVYDHFEELKYHDVIVYNHCFPESKTNGSSVYNEGEARLASKIAKQLLEAGLPATWVTILTFYEAQKKLVKDCLANSEVTIANVEAFQGRENEVIIVCVTRSNPEGVLGFIKNMNRVNVAISRAKYKMFILCNLKALTVGSQGGWKKFAAEISKISTIVQVQ